MKNDFKVFEINTRVFVKQYGSNGRRGKLSDVPEEYWKDLAGKGIHAVWLMGIWKTCKSVVPKCCFQTELLVSYSKALKDWQRDDVTGSPYAIDDYIPNEEIVSAKELKQLKTLLNKMGLKLILDFIPNHFSADTSLLKSHPEVFLSVDRQTFEQDNHTFFAVEGNPLYFAHGRDPFFPAWTDTIQVNYSSSVARSFMIDKMQQAAALCDGLRCDMAMLVLSTTFKNTWGSAIEASADSPSTEFWADALSTIKKDLPDFIFIAEAYWGLEWQLQELGFNFTYDKKMYDRLLEGRIEGIRGHLNAEMAFQKRSARFIENHDEERAIQSLGKDKSMAAAVIISTIPGMKLYHDGQFSGKRIKLPVQLAREPKEQESSTVKKFYNCLLSAVNSPVFNKGEWELLEMLPSWPTNLTSSNLLSWLWKSPAGNCLVVINYSATASQGRVKFDVEGYSDTLTLTDKLHEKEYRRTAEEIQHEGLYIDLAAWQGHIFFF